MLNTRHLENTLTTPAHVIALRIVKDENEVKRTRAPALQPVATIVIGGGNVFDARPLADIYPLSDGTLIRLEVNDDNTYDYKSATVVPSTHPAAKAYAKNPDQEIEISCAEESDLGSRANPADVKRLKDRLEADMRGYQQEKTNEHHLTL